MDADAGADSDGSRKGGSLDRSRFRKSPRPRAKSHSDVSLQEPEKSEEDSESPSPQPLTEPSSPYKKFLGFKSGKKIHNMLSTLRKLAPHKLRQHKLKEYRKNNLQQHNRMYASHPNVSSNDLAVMTSQTETGSHDDSAVGFIVTSSADGGTMLDGVSYSDPTINRNSQESLLPSSRRLLDQSTKSTMGSDTRDSGITLDHSAEDGILRHRQVALRKHPFYQLEVHLRFGKDLQIRDACGTSDPYVKFKIAGKQLYKSRTVPRTLEPYWDEFFTIPVEDVFEPLHLRVYDYDFALQDDYMGAAQVDLTQLELNSLFVT